MKIIFEHFFEYLLPGKIRQRRDPSLLWVEYRRISLMKKHILLGPYSRPLPWAPSWSQQGALSYKRGTLYMVATPASIALPVSLQCPVGSCALF